MNIRATRNGNGARAEPMNPNARRGLVVLYLRVVRSIYRRILIAVWPIVGRNGRSVSAYQLTTSADATVRGTEIVPTRRDRTARCKTCDAMRIHFASLAERISSEKSYLDGGYRATFDAVSADPDRGNVYYIFTWEILIGSQAAVRLRLNLRSSMRLIDDWMNPGSGADTLVNAMNARTIQIWRECVIISVAGRNCRARARARATLYHSTKVPSVPRQEEYRHLDSWEGTRRVATTRIIITTRFAI